MSFVLASRAGHGERARALPGRLAQAFFEVWCPEPRGLGGVRGTLAEVAVALGGSLSEDSAAMRARVLLALREGRLLLLRGGLDRGTAASAREPEEEVPTASAFEPVTHTLDFVYEYPDGTPVEGLDYTLFDPDLAREAGTLPDDGTIHRDNVRVGTYAVEIKDIERVVWEKRKIRCDEECTLYATVCGIPAGTAARVRIFREFVEGDADVVDTLQASVVGHGLEVPWRYDYATDDARKAEQGMVAFVAEVAFEGGKYWAKTDHRALVVELKTLASVRWSHALVAGGQDAEVTITTLGLADGAEVSLELWTHDATGDDRKLADLPAAQVAAGRALATVRFEPAGPDDSPDDADGTIHHAGEYFVRARLGGDAPRTARSGLLWCDDVRPQGA